ncbi:protein TolR [Gammaproteobacteria bacterium ESL0073]|uniref:Tol-Pal system protein TolR n=1 Tax=Entomomonas moraniae TaxID=2213226 RepID=A0A3Q9JKS9_9GAMM|nr:protein TolR [Entomomonas moraniae]AWM81271.1 protein TolR [Gammaproteobacteria bacterium ESL0073]AZS51898.1 protein TolR [Entomomonas moraniae]
MSRRNKRKPVAEMNVVPYIDVMLVLLVIFMVTAPMLNQGVKVDLPQVTSEPLPSDTNQKILTVSVKADGSYYLTYGEGVDNTGEGEKAVSLPEMTEKVGKILGVPGNEKSQVFVRGDKSASYGLVMGAMSALQQAGVTNVGLVTEAPNG